MISNRFSFILFLIGISLLGYTVISIASAPLPQIQTERFTFGYELLPEFDTSVGTGGQPVQTPPSPVYTGIPTISIVSVAVNNSVTIRTNNFPAGQTFIVTMGEMNTRGINGIFITTTYSGNGGRIEATYPIPEALRGYDQVAIRLESPEGYYAFNWFYNDTTNVTPGATPTFGSSAGEGTLHLPNNAARFDMYWPTELHLNQQTIIKAELQQSATGITISNITSEQPESFDIDNIPIGGTPEAPIASAFGPGYQLCAQATLHEDTDMLSVVSINNERSCFLTNRSKLTWQWIVRPKRPGPQILSGSVTLIWEPTNPNSRSISREVWAASKTVNTKDRMDITLGQITLGTIATGSIGTFFSAQFLYKLFSRKNDSASST